jgi:hypothetical protein
MPRRCDLWRIGVVAAPIAEIARAGSLDAFKIDWLDEPAYFAFEADPFAIRRGDTIHLFTEAFDYRERHGRIVHRTIASDGAVLLPRVVLEEPWHLSYPALVEDDGETYMLPEAAKGGRLTIYRAAAFPDRWERIADITLDTLPIDATPFRHDGHWWLAYASAANAKASLYLAFADQLAGPWTPHPGNPVRVDRAGARPGGTPFLLDGRLVLPVQDCTGTYGAAILLLAVDTLTCERFECEQIARLSPPPSAGRYREGLHTLTACGDVTLIDVKRIDRTGRGWLIDAKRWLTR